MKIDVFNHVLTKRYHDELLKKAPPALNLQERFRSIPALMDVGLRSRVMDQFEGYVQVVTLANPPVEMIAGPKEAAELSRIANDEMAELVAEHPDRFLAAAACLPMNDIDATLDEIDRVTKDLGFRGVQIYTHVNGRPLDHPDFLPVFEKMAQCDLPILLHPARGVNFPDYATESKSLHDIWHIFGWPYETAAAMTRIVFSGILDRYPDLKIITHHLGGMVPYFEARIFHSYVKMWARLGPDREMLDKLKKHPYDYFRMFYGDTALNGSIPGLECGMAFFGSERVLFATDMPFDSENGMRYIRETIRSVDGMTASLEAKRKIYSENAKRVFKLDEK